MPAADDLTALLRSSYDWAGVRVTSHDTGMNSRTWWVDHNGGRAVAKWVPAAAAGSLLAGVAAAVLAAASGVATGRPLGEIVEYDGGSLAVLEVVPGAELTGEESGDAEAIGVTLARVHAGTAGRSVAGALDVMAWVDPTGPALAIDEEVRAAVAGAVRRLAAAADRLTLGVGHGDPSPEAFLRDGDQVGLIDWASCVNGPLLFDLASAAMYSMASRPRNPCSRRTPGRRTGPCRRDRGSRRRDARLPLGGAGAVLRPKARRRRPDRPRLRCRQPQGLRRRPGPSDRIVRASGPGP